jgi:outer membrane protein OmpA-like peptidoglycan-associated protein
MKRFLGPFALAAAVMTGIIFGGGSTARAQGGPVDVQMFRPAMDSKGILGVETTQVLSPGMFSVGLVASYAHNPLTLEGDAGRLFKVKTLTTANIQFAIGLFKIKRVPFMEVGFGIPVNILTGNADPYKTNGDFPWDQNTTNTAAGVQAPLQYEDNGNFSSQGVGDIYVNLKSRFLPSTKAAVGLGAVLSFAFPASKIGKGDQHFMGSGGYTIWPRFVLDAFLDKKRKVQLALNVGARLRFGTEAELKPNSGWNTCQDQDGLNEVCQFDGEADNANVKRLIWQHDITVGLGVAWNLVDRKVDWVTELFGSMELTSFGKDDDYWKRVYPVELMTGLKVYLATNSFLAVAGGIGLTGIGSLNSAGAPDFRVLASFVFEPLIGDRDGDGLKDDVDKCPDDPEDFDDFEDEDGCPEPDNDKDGIPDRSDKCPNEPAPGTKDGCPVRELLDRDGDKIPDNVDKCPDDPEDFDSFEDKDGCPDDDNDGDGVPDAQDICRGSDEDKKDNFARTKEDMDGFKDDDGCPDPDNDKDRICDNNDSIQGTIKLWESTCKGKDQCPNEPETYNGYQDEDGCPDKGKVVVQKNRILILEKIYFETAKAVIKPVSYNILNAIAATLKANPSIKLVEIQGHADERGGDQYNMRLTDDRAHAVLRYLINRGISRTRLQAKGYGETKPVCTQHNESCWSKNRRVEFVIKKREAADDDF